MFDGMAEYGEAAGGGRNRRLGQRWHAVVIG